MPTRHRRVGVVLDPELAAALDTAADHLQASSAAGRLRELALIGASSLGATDLQLEQARRELGRLGATAARGDLMAISRRLRSRNLAWKEETATESLEWVRGQR